MDANLRRFIDLGRDEERKKSPCSLKVILTEVLSLLKPQCDHIGIDLQEEWLSKEFLLEGDPAQLADLFLNLLGNAMEAAGPGGKVRLSVLPQVIEIRDSGPGPKPEIAAKLFEPFVTGKPEGIGLGLAVAKQAAENHGGSIDWRRGEGETIFRVQLPFHE